jgi:hypothetical protein
MRPILATNKPSDLTTRLAEAIQRLHGCDASLVETVPVIETHGGRTVWQGVVHVFNLSGHSKADRCYAWESITESSVRLYAVLHAPPVSSAADAVRASIVRDFRAGR